MKYRDVVSMLVGITVAWNMYEFATNFFNRAWMEVPVPVVPVSYTLNAAIALLAPLAQGGKRWIVLASTVLGALMAVWSAVGVFFVSDEETELAPSGPSPR
jgi:hypothetical protein